MARWFYSIQMSRETNNIKAIERGVAAEAT